MDTRSACERCERAGKWRPSECPLPDEPGFRYSIDLTILVHDAAVLPLSQVNGARGDVLLLTGAVAPTPLPRANGEAGTGSCRPWSATAGDPLIQSHALSGNRCGRRAR